MLALKRYCFFFFAYLCRAKFSLPNHITENLGPTGNLAGPQLILPKGHQVPIFFSDFLLLFLLPIERFFLWSPYPNSRFSASHLFLGWEVFHLLIIPANGFLLSFAIKVERFLYPEFLYSKFLYTKFLYPEFLYPKFLGPWFSSSVSTAWEDFSLG